MQSKTNVVEIQNLTRQYGKTHALDDVSLTLQAGMVYGLVGANGAGKTTLIKHLLGLLRPQAGTVRVLGHDPIEDPVAVLSRLGYLSEERELPEWMRIDELLKYSAAFYPNWDQAYARELMQTFRLDGSKKIKHLSKGMRAQAGLVAAVAHHPELLLLDEPSTGLDAVVRKDILNAIIRTVADNGRTALFSSHLLDEVELMSDYVFMIDGGRLVLQGELEQITQQHHVLSLRTEDGKSSFPEVTGMLAIERCGATWNAVFQGNRDELQVVLDQAGVRILQQRNASLQEIFVASVGRQHEVASLK